MKTDLLTMQTMLKEFGFKQVDVEETINVGMKYGEYAIEVKDGSSIVVLGDMRSSFYSFAFDENGKFKLEGS